MDGFSSYNQINIVSIDQEKKTFIYLWGTFVYKNLPFGLKNTGAIFQWVVSYAFHDICNIIQPYMDDLPVHSRKRQDHSDHLWQIFLHCRHYNIRLNLNKFIFYIESRWLLSFTISKDSTCLDLLKVKAISNLPPPAPHHHCTNSRAYREKQIYFVVSYPITLG